MFLLRLQKWPIYQALKQSPVGGWPSHISREETESFIQKYDAPRTIMRIAKRNFETSLVALAVSAYIALLDFVVS
jgi:hypothetical protein